MRLQSLRWPDLALGLLTAAVLAACAEATIADQQACDGMLCDEQCVDLQTDPLNCGACGEVCRGGNACVGGVCTAGSDTDTGVGGDTSNPCVSGMICDGICVDHLNDSSNCGDCDVVCDPGMRCADGGCACGAGLALCGTLCVDTENSRDHCGACDNSCGVDVCVSGHCISRTTEVCDGEDNDLDTQIDEADDGSRLTQPCDNLCGTGTETCVDGTWQDCTAPPSSPEVCDGEDNDCDGLIDNGVKQTYYRDDDGDGYGVDISAVEACVPEHGYVTQGGDCDDSDPLQNPGAAEVCDALNQDENCDGGFNEGCECVEDVPCGSSEGICSPGVQTCDGGALSDCGGPGYVAALPGELCNGLDDDCNGLVDDNLTGDDYEPNNGCTEVFTFPALTEIPDGFATQRYNGEFTGEADEDWFRVQLREGDGRVCLPFAGQCDFVLWASLTVPESTTPGEYEICVYGGDACGATPYCTREFVEGTNTYSVGVGYEGTCAITDDRDWQMAVRPVAAAPSCVSYTIDLEFFYTDEDC